MSWVERAISKGAVYAGRLEDGAIREAALEGLEALAEPRVAEVLERRGEDALRGLAAHLTAEDLAGAERALVGGDQGGLAGALADVKTINEDRADLFAQARQAREDWAEIQAALASVGLTAIKLALGLALAGL